MPKSMTAHAATKAAVSSPAADTPGTPIGVGAILPGCTRSEMNPERHAPFGLVKRAL